MNSASDDSWAVDLVLQLLKTLISLSNDCETSVMRIICCEVGVESVSSSFFLDWILSFLYVLFQMREKDSLFISTASEKSVNSDDDVSSSKKRVISDVVILLLSLLINIAEVSIPSDFSSSEGSSSILFVDSVKEYDVIKSLRNYPLFRKILSQLLINDTKEKPETNGEFPGDGDENEHYRSHDTSLISFLLDRILKESSCFMNDLVSSDHCFAPINNRRSVKQRENSSGEPLGKVEESNTSSDREDVIPVEELYVSSYLVLFLNTLVFGKMVSSRTSPLDNGSNSAPHIWRTVSVLSLNVMSRLPNKNYWLFVRILKAFLALQGEVRKTLFVSDVLFFLHFLLVRCFEF
jgi:hypothetical protein